MSAAVPRPRTARLVDRSEPCGAGATPRARGESYGRWPGCPRSGHGPRPRTQVPLIHLYGRGAAGGPAAGRCRTRTNRAFAPVVAGLGRTLQVRWTVPRRGGAECAGAETDDLRAIRRGGGCANDVAARTTRWCTQLGLPLLLVARRILHAARALRSRVSRRSRSFLTVDVARHAADLARAAGRLRCLRRSEPR